MAPQVPIEQAVLEQINAAPNQRISHAALAENLRNLGYRNFGMTLMNMNFGGQIRGTTEIENNKGVLYYSPAL